MKPLTESGMVLPAAAVTVLRWYVWVQTLLLLLAQVVTNLLCHSLISMVDGFHTIYLFTQMTVFLFNQQGTGSSVPTDTAPASPPSPSSPPSLTPPCPDSSPSPDAPPSPTLPHCLPSPHLCGISFPKLRARSVEVFSSALCLATLSGTYFLEVIPQMVTPSEKHYPLVWTVVGAVSIFHNVLVLVLTRARVLQCRARATARPDRQSLAETGADRPGRARAGPGGDATAAVQSNGAGSLIFANPGALHPNTGLPGQGAGGDLGTPEHGVPPWDASDAHVPRSTSDEYADEVKTGSRWRGVLRAAWVPFQDLFAAVLAVIYGLVILLAIPDCVPVSPSCTSLVHVDVAFSALAIAVLLVCSVPQVYRYGLLLLQATPTNVSVSELSEKITCIPGVQSLHDFHVWQLTDSYTVASVHVRCKEGFQKHRCGDLILAVTKVIHSVGISCCTIQPEFALPPTVSSEPGPDAAPSPPGSPPSSPQATPARACGLACKKACEKKMCCSLAEEEPLQQE